MRELKQNFSPSDFNLLQLGLLCMEFNALPRGGGILDQHLDEMLAIGEIKKFFAAKMPKEGMKDDKWRSLLR
jgi:hypothetical protein